MSIQMMKHRKPYKTYTREFKQEAVRLMETTDRPAAEVAMELGIRRNQLYEWKQQLAVKGEAAFTGVAGLKQRTCPNWRCLSGKTSSSGMSRAIGLVRTRQSAFGTDTRIFSRIQIFLT